MNRYGVWREVIWTLLLRSDTSNFYNYAKEFGFLRMGLKKYDWEIFCLWEVSKQKNIKRILRLWILWMDNEETLGSCWQKCKSHSFKYHTKTCFMSWGGAKLWLSEHTKEIWLMLTTKLKQRNSMSNTGNTQRNVEFTLRLWHNEIFASAQEIDFSQ